MLTRSVLTTVIGFLTGVILYLTIEPHTTFIFLFGGLGYVIGVLLDTSDRKSHLEAFYSSSIPSTHEIFHSHEIPEAVVIYSSLENATSVLLDYRIEAKPENYRLSVLKNLQEFDFRIIEDTSQTFFSLCIEYPEFNYPSIRDMHDQRKKFFYDIEERSNDFQGAVRKLIPGIVINAVQNPDIFGNDTKKDMNSFAPSPYSYSPSSPKKYLDDQPEKKENEVYSFSNLEENNIELESEISESDQKIEDTSINEKKIIEDLKKTPYPNSKPDTGIFNFAPPDEKEDQFYQQNIEIRSKNDSKSKISSILTAKQIEELQDSILTHEENDNTEKKSENQLIDPKDEKNSINGIFDYSSVDNSSSMPMDEVGRGILKRLVDAIHEKETRLLKDKEKISSQDT